MAHRVDIGTYLYRYIEFLFDTDSKSEKLLEKFNKSDAINITFQNNLIAFSDDIAKGKFEYYEFDEELAITLLNCCFYKKIELTKSSTSNDYYTFYINLSYKQLTFYADNSKAYEVGGDWRNAIYVSSSSIEQLIQIPEGSTVQLIQISCRAKWLSNLIKKEKVVTSTLYTNELLKGNQVQFILPLTLEIMLIAQNLLVADFQDHSNKIFREGGLKRLMGLIIHNISYGKPEKSGLNFKDVITVIQMKEKIEKGDYPIPTLKDFSKECHMSKTKCGKVFSQIYGKPFSIFFMEVKMQIACRLLYLGHSINDIGKKIGYSNTSRFTSAFKSYFKTTPKRYQLKTLGNMQPAQT